MPADQSHASHRPDTVPVLPVLPIVPVLPALPAAALPEVLERCLRHAPAFIALVMGRDHVFEFVNDAYAAFIGVPASQLRGRSAFDVLSGVRDQGFEQLLERVWTSHEPYVGKGIKIRLGTDRPNPREMYADFVLQPVFDNDGAMAGIFFQAHDVTERHLVERAHEVAEKNQDIFLSKLAHELLTPLSAIRSAAGALTRLPAFGEPLVGRMVHVIQRQADSLSGLVNELSDLTGIKLGRTSLASRAPVVLQDVIRDAIDTCAQPMSDKQQALSLLMPERPVVVEGDALKLGRVVCNLLINASKYTPVQGHLELKLESCTAAVVSVSDNGIGLSQSALKRVFEMFSQEREGTDLRQGGLGIGLALVKQLVELHGGRVEAHSDGHGLGSTFVVRLPLKVS